MRGIKICMLLFFILLFKIRGQYLPVYSNYLQNPIIINPAEAGSVGAMSVALTSRIQWAGVSNSPQSHMLSMHSPVSRFFATGAIVGFDKFGPLNTTQFLFPFSYSCKIKKIKLSGGIQAGLVNLNNADNVVLIQEADPSFNNMIQQNILNAGGGLNVSNERFFAGFSVPAFFSWQKSKGIEVNFSEKQWFLYGGWKFNFSKYEFSPSLYLKNTTFYGSGFDINLMINYNKLISAGVSYRNNDAIAGIVNFKFNKQLLLGYTYDYLLSNVRTISSGSHEIFIRYDFLYLLNDLNVKKFK